MSAFAGKESQVDSFFRQSKKYTFEARNQIVTLEHTLSSTNPQGVTSLLNAFNLCISNLEASLKGIKDSMFREPFQKQAYWKPRVCQLETELAELKQSYITLSRRQTIIERETSMRNELLNRRPGVGHDATAIDMEHGLAREAQSLTNSSSLVDQILETGKGALDALYEQKGTLKQVKRSVLDIANKAGVSKSLIKSIERRENADKLIFYGGITTILILILVLYVWKHR